MQKGFGTQKLDNVMRSFPDLNRDWLIYGEGEMLKSNHQHNEVQSNNSNIAVVSETLAFLESKGAHINQAFEYLSDVVNIMKSKDEQINRY